MTMTHTVQTTAGAGGRRFDCLYCLDEGVRGIAHSCCLTPCGQCDLGRRIRVAMYPRCHLTYAEAGRIRDEMLIRPRNGGAA